MSHNDVEVAVLGVADLEPRRRAGLVPVDHELEDPAHVEGLPAVARDDAEQLLGGAVPRIRRRADGGQRVNILRQIAGQAQAARWGVEDWGMRAAEMRIGRIESTTKCQAGLNPFVFTGVWGSVYI